MTLFTRLFLFALSVDAIVGWIFPVSTWRRQCHEPWGCFRGSAPFDHLPPPRAPHRLGVAFNVYKRDSSMMSASVTESGESLRSRGVFHVELPTKVIIHGFQDAGDRFWPNQMRRQLLLKEPMNVVIVDWGVGARVLNYYQAVSDTRLIGRMVARLLETLRSLGANPQNFHLIGHSLGAHIAGYAAAAVPRVARITGLDPAGLSFEGKPNEARLDRTDAQFVDVIHTDAESLIKFGLGIRGESGHADFYPNGGANQPGCPGDLTQLLSRIISGGPVVAAVSCNHMRALYLFTESINSECLYTSRVCPNAASARTGSACRACTGSRCVRMGYHAADSRPVGAFYLRTNAATPYCIS